MKESDVGEKRVGGSTREEQRCSSNKFKDALNLSSGVRVAHHWT
jgi:hypothetical protein